jgi:hypothetical protein
MHRIRLTLFATLCLLLHALSASAQTETGQIVGRVSDQNGAVVPGASVSAKAVETGRTRDARTNDEGVYIIANLQPGLYEVTVSAQGFAPGTQRVQVTVGSQVSVESTLAVSAITAETVVVAGGGVEVNTQERRSCTRDWSQALPRTAPPSGVDGALCRAPPGCRVASLI